MVAVVCCDGDRVDGNVMAAGTTESNQALGRGCGAMEGEWGWNRGMGKWEGSGMWGHREQSWGDELGWMAVVDAVVKN